MSNMLADMSQILLRGVRSLPRLACHPVHALRHLPDSIESLRMRLNRNAIFHRESDLASASSRPEKMIAKAVELWAPSSVVDVGCGTGKALDCWLEHGIIDVRGIEGSPVAIQSAAHPELITRADLTRPVDLRRRFDLVYCVEVAEHIHGDFADEFVSTLIRHGDRILLTAARPGQGGMGHLNEQEPEYWVRRFDAVGYTRDAAAEHIIRNVKDIYWENVLVFARREA